MTRRELSVSKARKVNKIVLRIGNPPVKDTYVTELFVRLDHAETFVGFRRVNLVRVLEYNTDAVVLFNRLGAH